MTPELAFKGSDTQGEPSRSLGIAFSHWPKHLATLNLSLYSLASSVLPGKQTSQWESQSLPSDRHKHSRASAPFRPSANYS